MSVRGRRKRSGRKALAERRGVVEQVLDRPRHARTTTQGTDGNKDACSRIRADRRSNLQIDTYNGASIIAMKGKECVAIASDLRFGVQNQTLACDFPKVFKMHDKLYLGLSGLATDIQTL